MDVVIVISDVDGGENTAEPLQRRRATGLDPDLSAALMLGHRSGGGAPIDLADNRRKGAPPSLGSEHLSLARQNAALNKVVAGGAVVPQASRAPGPPVPPARSPVAPSYSPTAPSYSPTARAPAPIPVGYAGWLQRKNDWWLGQ